MVTVKERVSADIEGELHPLVAKLLSSRGLTSSKDLFCDAASLPKPSEMKGMEQAVAILVNAIKNNHRIKIAGDFDCDGCGATAVMIRGLKLLGVKEDRVSFIVPNRIKHGYGLTRNLMSEIPAFNQPDLIVTVDNGISAVDGVLAARERGIKVIVTDHHLPGDETPDADAIINPNQHGCTFPSKAIAGVGVAFYLLMGAKSLMEQQGLFDTLPDINSLLHIVALSTVCDVVPLDKLNRTFVEFGIRQIRAGKICEGMAALIHECDLNKAAFTTTDFGFVLGPRINSAGRLTDMSIGIKMMTTNNKGEAVYGASLLNSTNEERKAIEASMQAEASLMMTEIAENGVDRAIILVNEGWHEGVIGLLASRIKEKYYRPTFVFAHSGEGKIKASCRSIPGIHIRDVIAKVFDANPDWSPTFGGHAMAAGLSLDTANFERFKHGVIEALKSLEEDVYQQSIEVDGSLDPKYLNVEMAKVLPMAAPWGQSFPPPMFSDIFTLTKIATMGALNNHLRLTVAHPVRGALTAVAFNSVLPEGISEGDELKLIYSINANEFRGNTSLQLMVNHIMAA